MQASVLTGAPRASSGEYFRAHGLCRGSLLQPQDLTSGNAERNSQGGPLNDPRVSNSFSPGATSAS